MFVALDLAAVFCASFSDVEELNKASLLAGGQQ